MITEDELRQILPTLPQPKRKEFIPHLQSALSEFGITTRLRAAAFIAQIAHESMGLTRFVENLNYSAKRLRQVFPKRFPTDAIANAFAHQPEKIGSFIYANRLGNGPESSGDGFEYRGRGVIQLTGRDNYRVFGKVLGLDLEGNPDQVATSEVAFRTAGAFWKSKGCNELADQENFKEITRRINGGFIGLEDRQKLYSKAKQVLKSDGAPAGTRDADPLTRSQPTKGLVPGIVKEHDVPHNLSRGIYPGRDFADQEADKEGSGKKVGAKKSAKKAAKKGAQKVTKRGTAKGGSSRKSAAKKGTTKKRSSKKSASRKGSNKR